MDKELILAVKRGDKDNAEALLKAGANPNATDGAGDAAVVIAASNSRPDIVKVILDAGGDVNKGLNKTGSGKYGGSAIAKAILRSDTDMVKLLISRGAFVYSRDIDNAVARNNKEIVEVLLDSGFISDKALILACQCGYKEMVAFLLEKGANVNVRDHIGNTPLIVASGKNNKEMVELLVAHGAYINQENQFGETALSIAEKEFSGSQDVAGVLKKANLMVPDDIIVSTCWVNKADEVKPKYDTIFNEHYRLRRKHHYKTPGIAHDDPALIVWIVIHGTWGQSNKAFYDDSDTKDQNYRHIKRTASWYATRKRKKLDFYSFTWQAHLNHDDRQRAAQVLKCFLDEIGEAEVVVLGHSHGCNVANMLSRLVDPKRPINLLILFACPIRKEECYRPKNYKHLLYFWSKADRVAKIAKVPEENLIKLKINEYWYGDNDFDKPEEKITVQLQTKIDGDGPGHSEIINISAFLQKIIEKLHDDFLAHYCRSGDFYLNVASDDKDHPIYLVVLPLEAHEVPQVFDYLGSNNNLVVDDAKIVEELALAAIYKKRFSNKYNKKEIAQ